MSSKKMFYLVSVHPEMVDLGSGQDRSPFAPPRNGIFNTRNWSTLKIAKDKNAVLAQKMPFLDGHYRKDTIYSYNTQILYKKYVDFTAIFLYVNTIIF